MEETTLLDNIKDYIETRFTIVKLKVIKKAGTFISSIVTSLLLLVFVLFFVFFLSFSAAYAISTATGKPYLGFLLIAGLYLVLAVVLVLLKDRLITVPVINALLRKLNPDHEKKG